MPYCIKPPPINFADIQVNSPRDIELLFPACHSPSVWVQERVRLLRKTREGAGPPSGAIYGHQPRKGIIFHPGMAGSLFPGTILYDAPVAENMHRRFVINFTTGKIGRAHV